MTEEMQTLTNDIYDLTIRLGRHIEKVEQVNRDLETLERYYANQQAVDSKEKHQ